MGIFNDDQDLPFKKSAQRGPRGIGFNLTPSGDYTLEGKKLEKVGYPDSKNDAATQKYVQDYSMPKTLTTDLNFNGKKAINMANPVNDQDGCTKAFAQALSYNSGNNTAFLLTNGSRPMSGVLNMFNNRITNLADSINDVDSITQGQVKRNYLPKVQITDLDMNNKRIKNLRTPSLGADAVTKNYVDEKALNKSLYTINQFKLKTSDFSGNSGIAVFTFSSSSSDFHRQYHSSPTHVILSQTQRRANFSVSLGTLEQAVYSIRIEGIAETNNSGPLNLDFSINTGSVQTFKYKTSPHYIITNVFLTITNSIIRTALTIQTDFSVGKELALYIYGYKSTEFVDPLIVDNINYYEKIRIPRYASLESGEDRLDIIVETSFRNVDYRRILSEKKYYLPNSDFLTERWFWIIFPFIVSIKRISLKFRGFLGDWSFKYIDENTGKETHLLDIKLSNPVESVNGWEVNKILKKLKLTFKKGFKSLQNNESSYISSLNFITQEDFYNP